MKIYKVRAVYWDDGWELHVDGVGVTQVRTLDKAARQVKAFVETMLDKELVEFGVVIRADLGGLEDEVDAVRSEVAAAADAQVAAAARARDVARRLRKEKHLSVTDTAAVLGVSRGRVSQLTS